MKYVLNERFRFRGWQNLRTALYDTRAKMPLFLPKDQFILLMRCDGAHETDEDLLTEKEREFLKTSAERGVIRPAGFGEFLRPEQEYKVYPALYKKQAHWSITGACNLKCRHCFMSAPHARHGAPTHEQIIAIADQLAECGVFQVGLTGGEPLIREDFLEIVDALNEREIGIDVIYTNGWLVDEKLLDELDRRHVHPPFQLSYDGVGWHDFLRGVPGAEEKTLQALKLLQERKYRVSAAMCMHRRNRDTLRETVNLLASLGVRSLKCGSMMELGEWMSDDLLDLHLTGEEELEAFEKYIPQYFEDGAPLSLMLAGAFMYTPGDPEWTCFYHKECPAGEERRMLSCGVLHNNFYIGAEGMICPCMGMADCGYAKHFPNLFETPLKDILRADSDFIRLCETRVGDIRDHNPKCRECRYADRCTGGCRNGALMAGDDYYGIDPGMCRFFENNGEERIRAAAGDAFAAYLKRNPPRERKVPPQKNSAEDCP